MEILWGQKVGGYCLVIRTINKIKGYEVNFYETGVWATKLGFVKTKEEAKKIIHKHMENR